MTISLLSCITGQKKEKLQLDWGPNINAPKYYPAELVWGSFVAGDEKKGYKIAGLGLGGVQYGGWGKGGLEMDDGDFVPERLNIGWFSFAENKFYKGSFQLPTDTIYALFKEGYTDWEGDFFGYDCLIVNVYPLGGVALWMQVAGTRIVEIGHFQGEEMEYDGNSLYPSMQMDWSDFGKQVMDSLKGAPEYIAKHGISQEPFKTVYRQRYNYTIEIDNISHADTELLLFEGYNGEMDTMEGAGLDNNYFKTKTIPKYIYTTWLLDGVVYFSEIDTPEEEMFKAFTDMSTARPNEPFVVLLKPNYNRRSLTVSLRSQPDANGDVYEIEISKTGRTGKSGSQRFAKRKKE